MRFLLKTEWEIDLFQRDSKKKITFYRNSGIKGKKFYRKNI